MNNIIKMLKSNEDVMIAIYILADMTTLEILSIFKDVEESSKEKSCFAYWTKVMNNSNIWQGWKLKDGNILWVGDNDICIVQTSFPPIDILKKIHEREDKKAY